MSVVSVELLKKIGLRKARPAIIAALAPHFDAALEKAEITTPLRLAHFLAQAAHECDGFRTLEEYASGAAYEGRKDLGNTVKGDGRRYKGRGIFQLTGRANYRSVGKTLNLPLEQTPELAADPKNSVLIAVNYWAMRGYRGVRLNSYADMDRIEPITRAINGGLNGLDDRKLYLARAKTALGVK
jgi:putative chitinase